MRGLILIKNGLNYKKMIRIINLTFQFQFFISKLMNEVITINNNDNNNNKRKNKKLIKNNKPKISTTM